MQQLKAAFQVIVTIATEKLSEPNWIFTDRYDRRNRTKACLTAEWFPYNCNDR